MCSSKNFKHLFRGPFVLRTFGAHFTVTAGSVKVGGLVDLNAPKNYPFGGLGLSAAAVSNMFTISGTPDHYPKT